MNGFCGPYCGKVAVALVSEYDFIRPGALDARCQRRCTSMGSLLHIDIHKLVGKNGTANRGYPDGLFLQTHFIQHFHNDPVRSPVSASGAVAQDFIGHQAGLLVDQVFFGNNFLY